MNKIVFWVFLQTNLFEPIYLFNFNCLVESFVIFSKISCLSGGFHSKLRIPWVFSQHISQSLRYILIGQSGFFFFFFFFSCILKRNRQSSLFCCNPIGPHRTEKGSSDDDDAFILALLLLLHKSEEFRSKSKVVAFL
jgi:hypothetical protein